MRLLLFTLLALLAGCAMARPTPEQCTNADYGPPPREGYQDEIKRAMADGLFDAGSAQWELYEPQPIWWNNTRTIFSPGEIKWGWRVRTKLNAKNRFGAYTGWKTTDYYYRDGIVVALGVWSHGWDQFGYPEPDEYTVVDVKP